MVKKAEEAKKDADKQLTAIADVLVKEKLIEDKDKLDPAGFQKTLKELSGDKVAMANVNKLLEDAKIKDAGQKGVEKLIAGKKDVDDKLEAVNKLLADAKIKGEGAKGLEEALAARDQLAKERDELDVAIKRAYKELAGLVPPTDEPRAKIVEAVKLVRLKAESPLAIPLTHLGKVLSGLGIGAGKLVEKGYDAAALATELNFYRLRKPLIVTPNRKLDSYITLFQDGNRKDPNELSLAAKEAAWVLSKDAQASPEDRAKASMSPAWSNATSSSFAGPTKHDRGAQGG